MPLSKSDQKFYEEKLSLKSFGYLLASTSILGAILWPLPLFFTGGGSLSAGDLVKVATAGFLLGCVVSVLMYLGFKFLLQMHWLPSRR